MVNVTTERLLEWLRQELKNDQVKFEAMRTDCLAVVANEGAGSTRPASTVAKANIRIKVLNEIIQRLIWLNGSQRPWNKTKESNEVGPQPES